MLFKKNVLLKDLTTWGIGGAIDLFIEAENQQQLLTILRKTSGKKQYILGGGSNIFAPDSGVRGVVIRIGESGSFGKTRRNGEFVKVGAGVPLGALVRKSADAGLGGLTSLAGIPGTVGGAIAMNAGSASEGICERLVELRGLTFSGKFVRKTRNDFNLSYRSGGFEDLIITEAVFALDISDPVQLRSEIESCRSKKRSTQPLSVRSAGCVFKNPPGDSAGRLIDIAGLKGFRIGGAEVSTKHANFVVNTAGATASDIEHVIEEVRRVVHERFGIILELEVKRWE